jgi:ABC-type glycerol-3-phosphate transport system permease component
MNEAGRKTSETALRFLLIAITVIFVLMPIAWLVMGSLKSREAALSVPPQFLFEPDFSAYARIWSQGFTGAFKNSLLIALTNVVLTLVIGTPAAYALTRMKGQSQDNLSFWLLSIRMAPLFAVILPIYVLFKSLGLLDTRIAVAIAHLTMTLPIAIWMMVTYFRTIPEDLDQAALLDGATPLQVLTMVIIPIARPMLASVAIIVFIFSWNEFLVAFVLSARNAQTVPVAVASLAGAMTFDWTLISALAVCSMIPAMLFVGFAQRHIVSGLGSGAVK